MKLSDVMGAANLALYAEIGLVIFMVVFVAIAIRVFLPGRRQEFERLGRIPLEEQPVEPRGTHQDLLPKEFSK